MGGDHRTTLAAALRTLRARAPGPPRIYIPGCAGEPLAFADACREAPDAADDATFLGVWIPGVNRTDFAALGKGARSETIFLSPELRRGFETGRTILRPLSYVQAWRWLASTSIDIAVVQVTPPDQRGLVSLGVSADFSMATLTRRDVAKLALINPEMPRPIASPTLALDDFDLVVDLPWGLLRYQPEAQSPTFEAIATHVAAIVSDGDTLQFGLGNVQLSLLRALAGKRRLKIHSGMVSDPVTDAIDCGSIADEEHAITTGVALGGGELYRRAASDRRFRFASVDYTHSLKTLASIENLVAVNSAIEVDLFGQANAEYLGERQISGGGGICDFLRGAALSRGGKPIVALASTAKSGAVSRIVPRLRTPSVTLARNDVGFVATEYGVVDLRGLSIDERATSLMSLAHPDHRSALKDAWANIRNEL
jgi:acyl-CoA hydrolase